MKIGLCLLETDEVANYSTAIEIIKNENPPVIHNEFAKIFVQLTNLFYNFPIAVLFKKLVPEHHLPTHVLGLFCAGLFLQIILPFSKADTYLFKTNHTEIFFSTPFLFDIPKIEYKLLASGMLDFSSLDYKDEKEQLLLQYEKSPTVIYDPKTKTFKNATY